MSTPSAVDQLGGTPATPVSNDVLLVSILDRSASMQPQIAAVRSGYQELITQQAKMPGCLVSTITFDTVVEVLQVATPAEQSVLLNAQNYYARDNTALYDAVTTGINGASQWLSNHVEFKGGVKVVIFTDGEENASHETTLQSLNQLIDVKKAQGWEFVFLGSGESAWLEGKNLTSVQPQHRYNLNNSAVATAAAYAGVTQSLTNSRVTGQTVNATLRSNLTARKALVDDDGDE